MGDIVGMEIFEASITVVLTTAVSGILIAALLKLRLFDNEAGSAS